MGSLCALESDETGAAREMVLMAARLRAHFPLSTQLPMASITEFETRVAQANGPARDEARLARLKRSVEHVAHLLPAQGPITVFIHHNTLHAFEDLPFAEAVKRGGKVNACQPYLSEDRYRT